MSNSTKSYASRRCLSFSWHLNYRIRFLNLYIWRVPLLLALLWILTNANLLAQSSAGLPEGIVIDTNSNSSIAEQIVNQSDSIRLKFHNGTIDTSTMKSFDRWKTYTMPYLNISNGVVSNETFTKAIEQAYSQTYCSNDNSNWISDGPRWPRNSGNQSGQSPGGWIDGIYANSNDLDKIVIATRTSGFFFTDDGGNTWNCVTDSDPNLSVPVLGCFAMTGSPHSPDIVLAASGTDFVRGYLLRSTNSGQNWQRISNTPFDDQQIRSIYFSPDVSGLVLLTTTNGLYYSSDNGLNWSVILDINTIGLPSLLEETVLFDHTFINQVITTSSNTLYLATYASYSSNAQLFSHDFDFDATTGAFTLLPNSTWVQMSQTGTPSIRDFLNSTNRDIDNFKVIRFSNVIGNTFALHLIKTEDDLIIGEYEWYVAITTDNGQAFSDVTEYEIAISQFKRRVHLQPLLDKGVLLLASDFHQSEYYLYSGCLSQSLYKLNLNTSDKPKEVSFVNPRPIGQANGFHVDFRCGHINYNAGNTILYLGNDGGPAAIEMNLSSGTFNPIRTLDYSGQLSINLIHAFDKELDKSRTIYGFQDHYMKIRSNDGSFSQRFLGEGCSAMIFRDNHNATVGEDVYHRVADGLNSPLDLVDDNILVDRLRLFGTFFEYKYEPASFLRGLYPQDPTGSHPEAGVLMNEDIGVNAVTTVTTEVDVPNVQGRGIGAVSGSYRNPDIVYCAEGEPILSNTNPTGLLYKLTKTPGNTWTHSALGNSTVHYRTNPNDPTSVTQSDLFTLMSSMNNNVIELGNKINSIAVNHLDADKLYISLGGNYQVNNQPVDDHLRVLYSGDGGLNFTDKSQGLPSLPVNRLLYIESANGLVFAGTHAGVYYTNDNMSEWKCYKNNLPLVRITGMYFDYCNRELSVSTYGRGVWKTYVDLEIEAPSQTLTNNETWSTERWIEGDVVIPNNVTLTITNTVKFYHSGRIIVKPGGQLDVNGGTLTSECSDLWQGIYVAGNPNQPQYASNQGYVRMFNGGKVEKAITAISNHYPEDYPGVNNPTARTGGIIYCNNAFFENNQRDILLLPYSNGGGYVNGYNAQFYSTNYLVDDDFTGEKLNSRIYMKGVNNVQIKDCSFENLNTGAFSHMGKGICADAATFIVDRHGSSGAGCSFTGFADAIRANGAFSGANSTTIGIQNSTFTDNRHGIYIMGADNPKVRHNVLSTPMQPMLNIIYGFQSTNYGIYLDCVAHFTVEENALKGGIGFDRGIVVNESGPNSKDIRRNQVDGYFVGMTAIGVNQYNDNPGIGLYYQCNELSSSTTFNTSYGNATDIFITAGKDPGKYNNGIAQNQGNPNATTVSALPNNLFGNVPGQTAINNSTTAINYFYSTTGSAPELPRVHPSYTTGNVISQSLSNPGTSLNSWLAACPPAPIANPGNGLTQLQNSLVAFESDVNYYRELKDQLINGGNTTEIEAQLLFAESPQEYQDLYLELMNAAPFVEDFILMELCHLENYPELALRNIMIANPHASRNEEILDLLYSIEPALSQQTINDILQQQATFTTYDLLLANIAEAQRQSESTTWAILDTYRNDTVVDRTDEILLHLKSRDEAVYRYMLIESYLSNSQKTLAQAEITAFPNEVDLNDDEFLLEDWYGHLNLYNTILNNEGEEWDILALSSTTKDALLSVALDTIRPQSSLKAIALLHLNEAETDYVEPIPEPQTQDAKNSTNSSQGQRPLHYSPDILITPNPTEDEVFLSWYAVSWLDSDESIDIEIIDFQGRGVFNQKCEASTQGCTLSLGHLPTGVYNLQVWNNGQMMKTEKLMVKP